MFEMLELDEAITKLKLAQEEIARLKSRLEKSEKELLKASEIHGAVDVQKLCELWETCRENVLCNSLGDKCDVVELDNEGLVRFVLSVCEIVGFCRDEDEEEGSLSD